MKNAGELFEGKKITLLGLGLLGRGVGDAEFLAKSNARLIVTDVKSREQLQSSIAKLEKYPNIEFHLGGHRLEDFSNVDLVIKAAGVPLNSPEIAEAKKNNVQVAMSTALFAQYAAEAGAIIVGVTGTRGKSTTAQMISEVLKVAGKEVMLGGNVRGVSTLAMLPDVSKDTIAVLELDSWQLQGFGDLKISPHISVFTNLMPDHQNYYSSMEEYFSDKANIFRYQKSGDFLFVGKSILEKVSAANSPVTPQVPQALPADWKLKILGEHNRENGSLATAALRALKLSEKGIQDGLESFEGVEGRLQFVREVNGVRMYNDNNATTPEATIAALRAVGDAKKTNIVLIFGGDDKKLDMSKLLEEIPKWCSKVVMFKERGTDTVRDRVLALAPNVEVYEEDGLEATIKKAFTIAKPGETILYSPAFSSFGKYFKNEFDRGEQFMDIVNAL